MTNARRTSCKAQWPCIRGLVKIRSAYVRDPDLNLVEISEVVA